MTAMVMIREAVMELNASNDRGIDVVRNKIKGFAQQKVTLPPGKHKIIILGWWFTGPNIFYYLIFVLVGAALLLNLFVLACFNLDQKKV